MAGSEQAIREGQRPASAVRDLAPLTPGIVTWNLAYLASAWAVIAAVLALAAAHTTWWTVLLAFVVVSGRQQALLNVEHECIHGTFVRGRRWNSLVAVVLAASPAGSPYETSRARHLAHHRLLTDPADPDLPLHTSADKSTRGRFLRYFGAGLLGGYAVMVFSGGRRGGGAEGAARDLRNIALAQLALFGVMWAAFDWWTYPLLWALPLGTLTAFLHLVRSFVEHAVTDHDLPEHEDRLISISSNRIERFFVAPYFMNFHAEHHLYPWIPAPRLPEAQRRLSAGAGSYLLRSSYASALARHFKAIPTRASG